MDREPEKANKLPRRILASSMRQWPEGYRTKTSWKYERDHQIKRGQSPTIFEYDGREIPIYAPWQTQRRLKQRTALEEARHEHNRRFWLHARHDRYLLCDDGTSTIDFEEQRKKGRIVPWFGESQVCQHLLGDSIYGLFAEESFDGRSARTYWVAADLDLHLATGGNLALFREQVKVILRHCWGKVGSQIVIARERANGLHIYFFFKRPQDLERARAALRVGLQRIQKAYPDLERRIEEWNETLRRSGKTWRVRQIGDLEIYPDQAHGFRFLGVRGKDVIADKVIGMVPWGTYVRGKRQGQTKYGFDVISWWHAVQTGERMPTEEVEQIILSRLPTEQPALPDPVVYVEDEPEQPHPAPVVPSDVSRPPEPLDVVTAQVRRVGGLYRQTRLRLTRYWLGLDNPPAWFEKAVVVTARLLAKEGLCEDEAVSLLRRYAREIPEDARPCSSRLSKGDWASIDNDIARTVRNVYDSNGRQADARRSDRELAATIASWSKQGFRISDKDTWEREQVVIDQLATIQWTGADRRDIELWLMPALKVREPEVAVAVATEIVRLVQLKEVEGRGWGYAYLKRWLPDKLGIPCGKQAKQAAVFRALVDLKILEVDKKGRKGKATLWTLGARAAERLGLSPKERGSTTDRADLTGLFDENWETDLWGILEGEGGEREGGLLLCVPFNNAHNV